MTQRLFTSSVLSLLLTTMSAAGTLFYLTDPAMVGATVVMKDATGFQRIQTGPMPWNFTYMPVYTQVGETTLVQTPRGNAAGAIGWDDRSSHRISYYAEVTFVNANGQTVTRRLARGEYFFSY